MNSPVVNYCVICETLVNPDDEGREDAIPVFTDDPCMRCQQEIKEGNFIFVLISDKSDEERINRLHRTWVVEREEVLEEFGSLDQFNDEHIVFIPESQAMEIGLLDERITDPETGIRFDQMESTSPEISINQLEDTNE